MKKKLTIPSIFFFMSGLFLVLISGASMTGAVIGVENILFNSTIFISGLICLILSVAIFLLGVFGESNKIELRSAINKYKDLAKLAEDAGKNQSVQIDLDHLTLELSKGNLEAGLGKPGHVEHTDVFYLRARRGGRLYYHKINEEKGVKIVYEIVGKSSKKNEKNVRDLIKIYYK